MDHSQGADMDHPGASHMAPQHPAVVSQFGSMEHYFSQNSQIPSSVDNWGPVPSSATGAATADGYYDYSCVPMGEPPMYAHAYPQQSLSHSYINMSPGNVTPHSSVLPSQRRYSSHHLSGRGPHEDDCPEVEQIVCPPPRRVSPHQPRPYANASPMPPPSSHFAVPAAGPRQCPHSGHAPMYAAHQWEQLSCPYYPAHHPHHYYTHPSHHHPQYHPNNNNSYHNPALSQPPMYHDGYVSPEGYGNPPPAHPYAKKRKLDATQPSASRDFTIYVDRSVSPALSDITVSPAPSMDEEDEGKPSSCSISDRTVENAPPTAHSLGHQLQTALTHLTNRAPADPKTLEGGDKKQKKKLKPRAARTLRIDTLQEDLHVPKVLCVERHAMKPPKPFTFDAKDLEQRERTVVRTVSPVKSRRTVSRQKRKAANLHHPEIFRPRSIPSKRNTFYNEVSQSSSGE